MFNLRIGLRLTIADPIDLFYWNGQDPVVHHAPERDETEKHVFRGSPKPWNPAKHAIKHAVQALEEGGEKAAHSCWWRLKRRIENRETATGPKRPVFAMSILLTVYRLRWPAFPSNDLAVQLVAQVLLPGQTSCLMFRVRLWVVMSKDAESKLVSRTSRGLVFLYALALLLVIGQCLSLAYAKFEL